MAAAGKWKVYDQAKLYQFLNVTTNWKMALYTSASNANTLSITATLATLTNELANANGYTTGGLALTGVTWSQTAGTATFTCSNAAWTASGGSLTTRFAVIYNNATINAVVNPIVCVCLLDTTPADVVTSTGNTLTITINASGAFTLSGATTD